MTDEIKSFYSTAMQTVSRTFGITDLYESNQEDSVDARSVLVYVLSERGITDSQIASLSGLTRQCVNKLKNSVRYRSRKWAYRSYLQQISNELATKDL